MKTKVSLINIIIITVVVAILTAIIVPIVVNASNGGTTAASDESAVDLLNDALIEDEEANGKPSTLCEVWEILEAAGYNPEAAPLYSGNSFYYYSAENRVVLTNGTGIIYPAAYVGAIMSTLEGSAFIELSTAETDAAAHDASYASDGTCSICGAVNPN